MKGLLQNHNVFWITRHAEIVLPAKLLTICEVNTQVACFKAHKPCIKEGKPDDPVFGQK